VQEDGELRPATYRNERKPGFNPSQILTLGRYH